MPHTSDEGSGLAGLTVLAVFAHPDDESLACGGTIARLADAGVRVVLFCASRGERGSISDPALVPDGDLARIRALELHDAARVLGIAEVIISDHPDGSLRWAHVAELHEEIVGVITRYRPDAVITFDEDGLYWHLDHIGMFERTYTAVCTFGAEAPALYHVTMPHGAMRKIVDNAVAQGWTRPTSGFWGVPPDAFGLETDYPTVILDVQDWVSRKLEALHCHRTQMGTNNPFARIGETEARRLLGTECFRRAAIDGTGRSVLEKLSDAKFEDLRI